MLTWLAANWINILLCAAVVLLVGLTIRSMIRDRKAGKSSCGGSCANCGACG
ncbi:MAG: FeoB-associated Cys-rich membrane protein, partial [Oscillospiraceae bacterium]|nr:FeoB-associated Cys-rich membrane protein [Oscillospiraceae bacterium]